PGVVRFRFGWHGDRRNGYVRRLIFQDRRGRRRRASGPEDGKEGSGEAVAGNRRGMLTSTVPGLEYRRLRGKSRNAGALRAIGRSNRSLGFRDGNTHANKVAGGEAMVVVAFLRSILQMASPCRCPLPAL